MDFYKVSKQIIDSECPSIKAGLTSKHYFLMIGVVTTSMAYDYFLNAVWKSYGMKNVHDSDGKLVQDQAITTVMIIAS